MRMTVTLEDTLIADLRETTGIQETGALIRQALLEMQQREASRRLAALGGTVPGLTAAPRRKPPRFVGP